MQTREDFARVVVTSGLLSAEDLQTFWNQLPEDQRPNEAAAYANLLVQKSLLTEYQKNELLAGRDKNLVLGNYVILAKLGQGGMGMVLKAIHRRMERVVAIKVMSPEGMKSPDAVQRFHREVKAAAKLSHPNIVAAHDADEAKGTHFLVMEYVEGTDLSILVKKNGPFPVDQAVRSIIQAARGLEFAHKRGVIHRDIKPANLLLDNEGTVKILDMGLARIDNSVGGSSEGAGLTSTGMIMGTVDYMSPEQAMDTKIADARSDIYSLGCSLYYLLTGRCLYDGDTVMKKLMAHQNAAIPSLTSVSRKPLRNGGATAKIAPSDFDASGESFPALEAVFHRMVAKRPGDRPQSMTEVIAELERCLTGGSTQISSGSRATSGSSVTLPRIPRDTSGSSTDIGSPTVVTPKANLDDDSAVSETMISSVGEVSSDPQTGQTSIDTRGPVASTGAAKKSQTTLIASIVVAVVVLIAVGLALRGKSPTDSIKDKSPAIPTTASTAPANVSGQAEAPIDLLAMIELPRDQVKHGSYDYGPWTREGSTLISPAGGKPGRLHLRYEPPDEYEMTAVVQRMDGDDGVIIEAVIDGHRVEVAFDVGSPRMCGLALIDGKYADMNETRNPGAVLADRQPHTIHITVGKRSVRATVDDREVVNWEGDPNRLKSWLELPNPKHLTFASGFHQFKFHKLELRRTRPQPSSAVAPFNATQARAHQEAWAKHLGVPVEKEVTLPGGEKLVMMLIPPGGFSRMEGGQQFPVRITKPFYLGKYEVTQAQWQSVMGSNPSNFKDNPTHPVEQITWQDIQPFLAKLNAVPATEKIVFGLPTEAQWEYACRAGTTTAFSFGDNESDLSQHGWFITNANGKTHPAGKLKPNGFGLYDMHGNMWEWCADWFAADYYMKAPIDDPSNDSGLALVFRGGGHGDNFPQCRSDYRGYGIPAALRIDIGFRLAASIDISKSNLRSELPGQRLTPPTAVAPFDAREAREHQEAWAKHLGVPVEYSNSIGMKFVLIPPGEFLMGSTAADIEAVLAVAGSDEAFVRSEGPRHKVILAQPFYLGLNEVTQSQYEKVMGSNPSHFCMSGPGKDLVGGLNTGDFPVEKVSWSEAAEFCAKLSQQEQLKPFSIRADQTTMPRDTNGYRLPSEAEWEFACRAGTTTKFWMGDQDKDLMGAEWFEGNSTGRTHAVGELKRNPFGLHDIQGNVGEYVQDGWEQSWYEQFQNQPGIDPICPLTANSLCVIRGGYWRFSVTSSRSAYRYGGVQANRGLEVGFRAALSVDAVKLQLTQKTAKTPNPAIAPFDSVQARAHQEARAKQLGVPVEYENSIGMKFVLVPKGTGWLGGGGGKVGDKEVSIEEDFYLGKYEVTQEEWTKVVKTNPSSFSRMGEKRDKVANEKDEDLKQFPVEFVSWNDCQKFINQLNDLENAPGWKFTLPTEAQWEYACRGGPTDNKLDYGFDFYLDRPTNEMAADSANFLATKLGRTCKVGSYRPNRLGLYDMHGNVIEWCAEEAKANGVSHAVIRGGAWDSGSCAATVRFTLPAAGANNVIGLRLARVPVAKEIGNALDFNNKLENGNARVVLPKMLRPNEACTVEMYFTARSVSDQRDNRVLFVNANGMQLVQQQMHLDWSGPLLASRKDNRVRATDAIKVGQRMHLAGVSTGKELQLFVDGQLVGQALLINDLPTVAGYCYLGSLPVNLDSFKPLDGLIDEVRISTGVRYTENFKPDSRFAADANTLAVYHFDEGTGEVLKDSSGNNHHGEIIGAKWVQVTGSKAAKDRFDTGQVRAQQEALAKQLGVPVDYTNSIGMKFTPVPGTTVVFSIWDTRVQDYEKYTTARPGVNGAWKIQEKEGVPVGREPSHPVVGVSWEEAQAFCAWLTEKETTAGTLPKGSKYRLPTDAEWSTAVGLATEQGATPLEKSRKNDVDFPWGNDFPPPQSVGNYADESFHAKFSSNVRKPEEVSQNRWLAGYTDDFATDSPVGAFPANKFGLFDMGGNVCQWCEEVIDPKYISHVVRGASWLSGADRIHMLSSFRDQNNGRSYHIGFRCVLEPAPSSTQLFIHDPAFPQWLKDVQAISAEQQIEAVSKKLMELNPGFDGRIFRTQSNNRGYGQPKIENGKVTEIGVFARNVSDLSPLRAFSELVSLHCQAGGKDGPYPSLLPLVGMKIVHLDLAHSPGLNDLGSLQNLSTLENLNANETSVSDLTPLRECKNLTSLDVRRTKVNPSQVAALQNALPNCKIEWDDPAKNPR